VIIWSYLINSSVLLSRALFWVGLLLRIVRDVFFSFAQYAAILILFTRRRGLTQIVFMPEKACWSKVL